MRELNNATLRSLDQRDLALHLRAVATQQPEDVVAKHLLAAIEQEALPPTVYSAFLSAVHTSPLLEAIKQQFSRYVREVAIRFLGKRMRGAQWETAWWDVGGMQGLLSLLAQMSVLEVKLFCKVIGRCAGQSNTKGEKRADTITELIRGLLPAYYPASLYKSSDQRSLHRHYAQIVPACGWGFVEDILRQDTHILFEVLPAKYVVRHHAQNLQNFVLNVIARKTSLSDVATHRVLIEYLPPLLQSTPPLPSTESVLSASISFSEIVLQQLASRADAHFPINLSTELLAPLLRRLRHRKVDYTRVQKILDLAIHYYREHQSLAQRQLLLNTGGVIFHAAELWSQAPERLDAQLTNLLQLRRDQSDPRSRSFYTFYGVSSKGSDLGIFSAVKQSRRYDLLRLLCLHTPSVNYNIESDQGLKAMRIQKWPASAFYMLSQEQGLLLLQRLIQVTPESDFIDLENQFTLMSHPTRPGARHGDPKLLLTLLQHRTSNAKKEAGEVVDNLKRKAATTRDQDDRAFFAKSTVFYAIASGSLQLYRTVVRWMRRFSADYKVVKVLYAQSTCHTIEGLSLLSGISENLSGLSAEDIHENVLEGNGILLDFLETAVLSLREPSFYSPDWAGPLSLFRAVVMIRIAHAGRLKAKLQLSDRDVYNIIWAPTLETLIQAENIGLAQEHASLSFNSPHGPLCFSSVIGKQQVKPNLPSTNRFLDDLALARDALWQDFRPTLNPAAAAIKQPFPRGLPIQCLTGPYDLATDAVAKFTPFLAARAEAIVMIDSSLALDEPPTDEETKLAVGQFVDLFDVALAIYIMQRPSGPEREAAISAAASHMTNELSRSRFFEDEDRLFWRKVFARALPRRAPPLSDPRQQGDFPVIPTNIDPLEPIEWNPEALAAQEIKARKLTPTVLDCLLCAPGKLEWREKHRFNFPEPKTPAASAVSMWGWEKFRNRR